MPHDTWVGAVAALGKRLGPPSLTQLALAEASGLNLSDDIPVLVAAALLRDHLAPALATEPSVPASDYQLEYLADLAKELGEPLPDTGDVRSVADAWIRVMLGRRAERALRRLRLGRGDVVSPTEDAQAVEVVSSISDSGRVNFVGGQGRGSWPHRLAVRARASDVTGDAERLRAESANQHALRASTAREPTEARLQELQDYRVDGRATGSDIELLADTVSAAEDERPLQRLLQRQPALLGSLLGGSWGNFVRSQVRLSDHYVPDFLLVEADSAGLHWTLVELESPRAVITLAAANRWADKARAAIGQIEEWREWLQGHLAHARSPRAEGGLGLPDIRPESPGLIIIGRRGELSPQAAAMRRRLLETQSIRLQTYDWLIDSLNPALRSGRPGGPLRWAETDGS